MHEKQPNIYQKSNKNQPQIDLGAVLEARWAHIAFGLGILLHLGGLLGRLGPNKVANMIPKGLAKRSQNRSKIEAKSDQFFMALGVGFVSDIGGFI